MFCRPMVLWIRIAVPALLLTVAVPAQANAAYEAGVRAFKSRNYYSARLLFQEVLQKEPLGEFAAASQFYLALTYFHSGDFRTSIFELQILKRDFPASEYVPRADFYIGESQYYSGLTKESLQTHADFIRNNPGHPLIGEARFTRGYIYLNSGRYDEAGHEFERGLAENPSPAIAPRLSLHSGIAKFNAKDYTGARKSFQDTIVKFGNDSSVTGEAFHYTGRSYREEGNCTEAIPAFTRAFSEKLSPVAAEAGLLLARCQEQSGNPDDALTSLASVLRDHPQSPVIPEVHYLRAEILGAKQDASSDVAAITELERIFQNYAQSDAYLPAVSLFATIGSKADRWPEAEKRLLSELNRTDLDKKTRKSLEDKLASLYYERKDFVKAAGLWQSAARTIPDAADNDKLLLNAAQAEFRKGDQAAARDTLTELGKKYPASSLKAESVYLEAEIDFAAGDYNKALKGYRNVTSLYKNHPRFYEAWLGAGWCYFELRQYARAQDEFQGLLKKAPERRLRLAAFRALGASRFNLRDFKGTEEAYKSLAAEASADPADQEALEEAAFQLAYLPYRQNDFVRAEERFIKFAQDFPSSSRLADALYFTGWSRYSRSLPAEAVQSYNEALKVVAVDAQLKPRILLDAGKAATAAGLHEQAFGFLRRYLNEHFGAANTEEIYYHLAKTALQAGSPERAEASLTELTNGFPQSGWRSEIAAELAAYFRKSDIKKSDLWMSRAVEMASSPDQKAEANLNRATSLMESGQSPVQITTEILSIRSEEAAPYRARALVLELTWYLRNRDPEAAQPVITREKDMFKELPEAEVLRIRLQILSGKFADAEAAAKVLMKKNGYATAGRYLSGEAQFFQGKTDAAFDAFRLVAAKSSDAWAPRATMMLADIYQQRKKDPDALREYNKVIYLYSGDPELYEKALGEAAEISRRLGLEKEKEEYLRSLREAFPRSKYLQNSGK